MSRYLLSDGERESVQADLDRLTTLRDRVLMADRLLRNCDECNIPRHYQDRSR